MIKRITENEIPECVEVIKKSFLTVAEEFGITPENAPRFTAFSISGERLLWQLHNENRKMYGYFQNSRMIGYYSLLILDDEECELNNLSVLPEWRHHGIGEKLLHHSLGSAKESRCSKITLGLVDENEKLKKWYLSFGFVQVETKKFDFFPFTCGYMEKEI